jgi:hypothetical protein
MNNVCTSKYWVNLLFQGREPQIGDAEFATRTSSW